MIVASMKIADTDLKASARRALHYVNELLVSVRLAFANSQNKQKLSKQVLVMIKHCLGNLQIYSIPAWSKEFSYITFLYRTNAKVYEYNESESKEIFDPENSPFIN